MASTYQILLQVARRLLSLSIQQCMNLFQLDKTNLSAVIIFALRESMTCHIVRGAAEQPWIMRVQTTASPSDTDFFCQLPVVSWWDMKIVTSFFFIR